jgi:Uma2 family endonuclease
MATVPLTQHVDAPIERWRFTVDEYYRMAEAGVFPPDARVELINGDVLKMPPIGSHHSGAVDGFDEVVRELLGRRASVSVQGPLRVGLHGGPQPDLLVLRRRDDHYRTANPTAADVLLVVEVSDSTLNHDRHVKGPMYAAAGILDYWIVNLVDGQIEVYRDPSPDGYTSVDVKQRGESVSLLSFPDVSIAVMDILG